MPKILFLSMTCRESLFINQNEIVKETWAKDIIDGKYGENVNFLLYDGWENDNQLDIKNNILHVRCEDDSDNTFKKTYYALKFIQNKYNYDFIFRTNTSTYINVPLVIKLIEHLDETSIYDQLWVAELMSLVESNVPFPLNIYGRGNGLLMSRKIINILINEGFPYLYDEVCDDIQIGKILNSYWMKQKENYLDHIKSFGHAWFRCVEICIGDTANQLCSYANENSDFEYLKNFLTIQIKQYYHRSDETENYLELYKSLNGKIDNDIDKTLEKILNYSKNSDVFIGSILGYITLDKYKNTSKEWLWDLECKYKADNDIYKEKFKNKLWL